jgi:hypothetical protein
MSRSGPSLGSAEVVLLCDTVRDDEEEEDEKDTAAGTKDARGYVPSTLIGCIFMPRYRGRETSIPVRCATAATARLARDSAATTTRLAACMCADDYAEVATAGRPRLAKMMHVIKHVAETLSAYVLRALVVKQVDTRASLTGKVDPSQGGRRGQRRDQLPHACAHLRAVSLSTLFCVREHHLIIQQVDNSIL